jgi:hypothetical protein
MALGGGDPAKNQQMVVLAASEEIECAGTRGESLSVPALKYADSGLKMEQPQISIGIEWLSQETGISVFESRRSLR